MQRVFRKILSVLCAALLLLGIAVGGGVSAEKASADSVSEYYAGITATGGEALLGQLHDLMCTTHTYYNTYGESRDDGNITDPSADGTGVVDLYTHETIQSFGTSKGTWNREHVWCKSLSNGLWTSIDNNGRGGGADYHHIRPTEMSLNSTRNNRLYGEVTNGTKAYGTYSNGETVLGGTYSGEVFEPLDFAKGDVARIVMYVYMHYNTYANVGGTTNGSGSSKYFGTLTFRNIIEESSEDAAIELLLEWNKLDPVDAAERTRNTTIAGLLGNRNPFIDHPEYADAIWGDGEIDPTPEPEPGPDPKPAEGSFTITGESFTMASTSYGFHPWSSGGVNGTAYLFGNNKSSMQFNKDKPSYYLASTTAAPGAIKSVTVKLKTGETARPWKLLTSDSAYGEVAGKPTNGADHGTKTVTEDGVTWELTGDDVYFALTYELTDLKGACYLDSIVVEYGDDEQGGGSGEQGGGPQTDESKVNAFRAAVGEIVSEGPLEARAASINKAITAYRALSEAEREEAEADVQTLQAAIEAYNEIIRSYNAAARGSEGLALGAGGLWE